MFSQSSTYFIEDMCCADEESLIRKKLEGTSGIANVKFSLIARRITVEHTCPPENILRSLKEIGFEAHLHSRNQDSKTFRQKHSQLLSVIGSGVFLFIGLLFSYSGFSEAVSIVLFLFSILLGGWKIAIRGFSAAIRFSLDMNFLMTIATLAAIAIGKWEEGAAVIFLFALSLFLESHSMDRSRKAIRMLMDLTPPTASVKRDKFEIIIKLEDVAVGEHVIIRPGERIPLDGTVRSGNSAVNQSAITGESLPVGKQAGDAVYAGSLNERGTLEITTTRPYYDTLLSQIIRMVEEAESERAPTQQFVERFAHYYTPSVVVLAILCAALPPIVLHQSFAEWFYKALVLLVIACPCALVISTPITIVSAISNAARNGVLIKGGRHLEAFGTVSAIAFDKTGTLTTGMPRVTDVIPMNAGSPREIIQLAAAVESKSEHPLAAAVLERAFEENIAIDHLAYQHFESLTGRGVRATINGEKYTVGNHAFMEEQGICSPEVEDILQKLESEGKTTVILGTEKKTLGIIGIADELRSNTRTVMRRIRDEGITRTIMLTGDNAQTAKSIATAAGIDEVHANILPAEKVNHVLRIKELVGPIAMVGDGINDAPALAASTVGIAMGITGTGVALETADIVLMSDDLSKLPYLMRLSKSTRSIITQNIAIALATKLIFMMLAISGVATLWMAVLADDGAALVVILNGLRALRSGYKINSSPTVEKL